MERVGVERVGPAQTAATSHVAAGTKRQAVGSSESPCQTPCQSLEKVRGEVWVTSCPRTKGG